MTKQEYIKLKREYFYKCKDILATKFDVDINDIEIITAKCDECCILDTKGEKMFWFKGDIHITGTAYCMVYEYKSTFVNIGGIANENF